MASITIYPYNILESGTVTVTGSPATGYPESRLYDRSIDFYWRLSSTGAVDFKVDQGAVSILAVDFLAVGVHNFDGEDLEWQYSTDDISYSDAVTDWTQSGNAQIIKELGASQTKRYWQLTLTSMVNPRCTEIFMGLGYEFDVLAEPSPVHDEKPNVQWNRSIGGGERATKFGALRRVRDYTMSLDSTDLASFRAAMAYLDDYSKPFWIKDHEDNYFLCKVDETPAEDFYNKTNTAVSLRVVEVL